MKIDGFFLAKMQVIVVAIKLLSKNGCFFSKNEILVVKPEKVTKYSGFFVINPTE